MNWRQRAPCTDVQKMKIVRFSLSGNSCGEIERKRARQIIFIPVSQSSQSQSSAVQCVPYSSLVHFPCHLCCLLSVCLFLSPIPISNRSTTTSILLTHFKTQTCPLSIMWGAGKSMEPLVRVALNLGRGGQCSLCYSM